MRKSNISKNNRKFIDSAVLNNATFIDYLERFRRIALSMFEWKNLPPSMSARWLELCLFFEGKAALLKDENYGFINTKCTSNGDFNIYGLPTKLNCFSYSYHADRNLYTGLTEDNQKTDCILVMNDWEGLPTAPTLELYALRLYECQRACDVNIKTQKFPIMVLSSDKQQLTMKNLYNEYDGNQPFIFGDKNILKGDELKAINTGSPFVADKLTQYKKEIWNECLTYLGINNIMLEKKERLVTDEANSNNELINLNLQSRLAPREEAARQFNELFGLTGNKAISVRVRSDLYNIIKNELGITSDLDKIDKEGDIDG